MLTAILRGSALLALFLVTAAHAIAPPAPLRYEVTPVLGADRFTNTENVTVTAGGRTFFIGVEAGQAVPSAIFEVVTEADGHVGVVPLQRGYFTFSPCTFTGLTSHGDVLYAACTAMSGGLPLSSRLVRIDLTRPPGGSGYLQHGPLFGFGRLPNGMATDDQGRLYISDSSAVPNPTLWWVNNPSIVRASISPGPFGASVKTTSFYRAHASDWMPNGLQYAGGELYFATGGGIKAIVVTPDGGAGAERWVYQAPGGSNADGRTPTRLIDDFTVIGNGTAEEMRLLAAEITLPAEGNPSTGQLLLLRADGEGAPLEQFYVGNSIGTPSSLAYIGTAGGRVSAWATSWFDGGLYRVDYGRW